MECNWDSQPKMLINDRNLKGVIPTHSCECTYILQDCTQWLGKFHQLMYLYSCKARLMDVVVWTGPHYGTDHDLLLFTVWFGVSCRFKTIVNHSKSHTRICPLFIVTGKLCSSKYIVNKRLCLARTTWLWNMHDTGIEWMLVIWLTKGNENHWKRLPA